MDPRLRRSAERKEAPPHAPPVTPAKAGIHGNGPFTPPSKPLETMPPGTTKAVYKTLTATGTASARVNRFLSGRVNGAA